MAQSKILLNIHYYEGKTILEIPRIYPGIYNGCIILSEKSEDEEYDKLLKDEIIWINEDNIIKEIKKNI